MLNLGDIDADHIDLTTPTTRTTRNPDVALHTANLTRDQWTLHAGLPVTTPETTITDLAATGTDLGHLATVTRDAALKHDVDTSTLEAALDHHANSHGYTSGRELLTYLLQTAGAPAAAVDVGMRTFVDELHKTLAAYPNITPDHITKALGNVHIPTPTIVSPRIQVPTIPQPQLSPDVFRELQRNSSAITKAINTTAVAQALSHALEGSRLSKPSASSVSSWQPDRTSMTDSTAALRRSLESRFKNASRTTGQPSSQIRRRFFHQCYLARVFTLPGNDWVLKGGVGLAVRVSNARHSIDIDLYRQGARDELDTSIEQLITAGGPSKRDPFIFEVTRKNQIIGAAGGTTLTVKCLLGTRQLDTFPIDLTTRDHTVGQLEEVTPEHLVQIPQVMPPPPMLVYPWLTRSPTSSQPCTRSTRKGIPPLATATSSTWSSSPSTTKASTSTSYTAQSQPSKHYATSPFPPH